MIVLLRYYTLDNYTPVDYLANHCFISICSISSSISYLFALLVLTRVTFTSSYPIRALSTHIPLDFLFPWCIRNG
jgi:hypothetical protein